jgi:hypothetical protein
MGCASRFVLRRCCGLKARELGDMRAIFVVQRRIDVRQMICGDVAHESAHDFVVAHASVQPAHVRSFLERE